VLLRRLSEGGVRAGSGEMLAPSLLVWDTFNLLKNGHLIIIFKTWGVFDD